MRDDLGRVGEDRLPILRAMERSELRAADVDRRRVVDQLERHYVDGRLTSDELSDRMSRAMAARTYGELDTLLHDLPPSSTPPESDPAEADEQIGPWRHTDFRAHALSYLMVMTLLVAIWLLTTPGGYFWPIWPMLGWGIGVAWHALARGSWGAGRRHEPGARRGPPRD
jgi:hypothetical protein